MKKNPKFEDYKNCSESIQIKNKIHHLEKKIIKNNKLIWKKQQTLKSENQSSFTEEINNIALSSKDDKNAINWLNRNICIRLSKDVVCK